MGCGGSSKKGDGIDMNMDDVGVSDVDQIFQSASNPLGILAKHHDKIT